MMGTKRSWETGLFVAVVAGALALAGCGGGGATSSIGTGAPAGPAAVEISFAAASATGSAATPVMVSGSTTVPSADPSFEWPERVTEPDPRIAHVFMDVVKVALLPADEPFGGEDMDGDLRDGNSPDPSWSADKPHFVTFVPESPIRIDLLKLENGKKLARFLNRFDHFPEGAYDKIRVYYRNVDVFLEDGSRMRFHPTANSKFDIHFLQGYELKVPATTDTTQPDGWVRFFRVKLDVVGLKVRIVGGGKSWKGCKVILRPQIFAKFVPDILYSVAGTASHVSSVATLPVSGTFDVSFGTGAGYPRIIHAAFDNDTTWAYSDDVLACSSWTVGDVPNTTAVPAFQNRAKVMAIGPFDASLLFQATEIVFTFPDVRQGEADNVWLPPDNTAFIVRSQADNVTVFPTPDRSGAYYDNLVSPHLPLAYTDLDNTLLVRARGYFDEIDPLKLRSYWISIGGPVGP